MNEWKVRVDCAGQKQVGRVGVGRDFFMHEGGTEGVARYSWREHVNRVAQHQ